MIDWGSDRQGHAASQWIRLCDAFCAKGVGHADRPFARVGHADRLFGRAERAGRRFGRHSNGIFSLFCALCHHVHNATRLGLREQLDRDNLQTRLAVRSAVPESQHTPQIFFKINHDAIHSPGPAKLVHSLHLIWPHPHQLPILKSDTQFMGGASEQYGAPFLVCEALY